MNSTFRMPFDYRECNHLRFNLHMQPSANTIINDVLNLNAHKNEISAKLRSYSSHFFDVMCNDCWINITAHIAKIFAFINNYQLQHSGSNYIESVDGYHQYLFMHYILTQSNIIQYILKHKELYELMFIICTRFFRMIYVDKGISFVVRRFIPPTKTTEFVDTSYVLYNKQRKWKRGTTEFLKISQISQISESFIKTSVYWKKKHFKYMELKLDFINFIKHDITQILLKKYRVANIAIMDQFVPNLRLSTHCRILYIINWFKICNRYKFLDFNQQTNEICLRRLLYIYFNQSLLKHVKVQRPQSDAFIWNSSIKTILRLKITNTRSANNVTQSIKQLIENNKRHRDKNLDEKYRGEYSYSTKCCSPKCQNFKCDTKDILREPEVSGHPVFYDAKYIYRKFYRCKRCRIVTYCSKHCQKIHWNKFGHKKQCDLFKIS
eukprot:347693_1